jgi:hypothetical protein
MTSLSEEIINQNLFLGETDVNPPVAAGGNPH